MIRITSLAARAQQCRSWVVCVQLCALSHMPQLPEHSCGCSHLCCGASRAYKLGKHRWCYNVLEVSFATPIADKLLYIDRVDPVKENHREMTHALNEHDMVSSISTMRQAIRMQMCFAAHVTGNKR